MSFSNDKAAVSSVTNTAIAANTALMEFGRRPPLQEGEKTAVLLLADLVSRGRRITRTAVAKSR